MAGGRHTSVLAGVSPAMAILSVQHTQVEHNLTQSDQFSAVGNYAKTRPPACPKDCRVAITTNGNRNNSCVVTVTWPTPI